MEKIRLVIEGSCYHDDEFDELLENLPQKFGAKLIYETSEEPDLYILHYKIWQKGSVKMFFVNDYLIMTSYFIVKGQGKQAVVKLIEEEVCLEPFTNEDVEQGYYGGEYIIAKRDSSNWVAIHHREMYWNHDDIPDRERDLSGKNLVEMTPKDFSSDGEYVAFIKSLTLVDTSYNEVFFTIFKNALFYQENEEVRLETLCAMHYVWWDELKPLLVQLSRNDESVLVRGLAEDFLSYFDKFKGQLFIENNQIAEWWDNCLRYLDRFERLMGNARSIIRYVAKFHGVFRELGSISLSNNNRLFKEVIAIIRNSDIDLNFYKKENALLFESQVKPIILKYISQTK